MTIAIAICPSLQDGNVSNQQPEGFPPYNEAGNNQWFAREALLPALLAEGMEASIFVPWNQSEDEDHGGELSGLREQMSQATRWLDAQQATWKAVLSLHTDSGNWGHTFGLYGLSRADMREMNSARLAHDVAARVTTMFERREYKAVTKLGSTNYSQYIFWLNTVPYASMLLEICSHQVAEDLAVLYAHPRQVAGAIVDGILVWYGQVIEFPAPPPPSDDADRIRRAMGHLNQAVEEINLVVDALR